MGSKLFLVFATITLAVLLTAQNSDAFFADPLQYGVGGGLFGDSYGNGFGYGYGNGLGYGFGNGLGYGFGNGFGFGYGNEYPGFGYGYGYPGNGGYGDYGLGYGLPYGGFYGGVPTIRKTGTQCQNSVSYTPLINAISPRQYPFTSGLYPYY